MHFVHFRGVPRIIYEVSLVTSGLSYFYLIFGTHVDALNHLLHMYPFLKPLQLQLGPLDRFSMGFAFFYGRKIPVFNYGQVLSMYDRAGR